MIRPFFLACLCAASPAVAEPVTWSLLGAVGASDDSNLFRLSKGEIRAFGDSFESIDDQVLVPQGAVNVRIPFGLQALELRGAIAGRFHAKNTGVDSTDYSLLARFNGAIGTVCQGTILAEQKRRLGNLDDLDEPGRNIQRERHASLAGDCAATPRLSVATAAEYRDRTSPDREKRRTDLEESGAGVRITHGAADSFQPFVAAKYRHRAQPNFISFSAGRSGARADIWEVGGGGNWAVLPKFKLTGGAYWTRLREGTHRRDEDGFVSADAAADWELSVKTSVRLYASRDLAASPNVGAIAYPEWLVGGLVTWLATPNLTSTFSLERRHRDILRDRTPVLRPEFTRQESDTTLAANWSVDFAVTDPLHVRLGVDHRRRAANFEDLRFKATTVSLTAVYRFGGPAFDTGL